MPETPYKKAKAIKVTEPHHQMVDTADAFRRSDRSLIEALRNPSSADGTTQLSWPASSNITLQTWP